MPILLLSSTRWCWLTFAASPASPSRAGTSTNGQASSFWEQPSGDSLARHISSFQRSLQGQVATRTPVKLNDESKNKQKPSRE
ncbi:hypothetical protein OJ253_3570 [Cryptosporidium canis]|uniref:Secreted protein n=1 Tax=Cryptosporidium canis TaxID=195482 RepID=A0A9D5DH83_9CRYT|nr:hypothetical protein OJ253_3570 [Cryptosporidium canis]